MAREFSIIVQMNTDTASHNPLCSLRARGYDVWTNDMTLLHRYRTLEMFGVTVVGAEESIAFEVLASHPAVTSVVELN